jgi:nucleotide-binding universal stress UspA family protein
LRKDAASVQHQDPSHAPLPEETPMTYGTLLVHLGDDPHLSRRTDLAIHLACRFESHLVGLAASGNATFEQSAGAALLARDELRHAAAAAQALAEARAQAFVERAGASRVRSCEAIVVDDDDAPALIRLGLCADLVVLGQPEPGTPGHARVRAQFEQALIHGAPPAIVVPHAADAAEVGRTVLVAWNDSRECARAVAAALPLLQRATEVHVVQFDATADAGAAAEPARIERVRDWLARDGVRASAWRFPSGPGVGPALLERTAACGADLVVMGGWGRARWSERVFGSTTRAVLARMTIPVLIAR